MFRPLVFPVLVGTIALIGSFAASEPARAGGGGFCHQAPALNEAAGSKVDMKTACFSPTVLRVSSGTEVTFHNADPMPHLVTGVALAWGSLDYVEGGKSATYAFESPGSFPYSCNLHPGMSGVIVVGDGTARAGAALPVSEVRQVAPGQAPLAARAGPQEPEKTSSVPAAATPADSDSRSLVFAGLGVLIGAVAVSLGVSARRIRR